MSQMSGERTTAGELWHGLDREGIEQLAAKNGGRSTLVEIARTDSDSPTYQKNIEELKHSADSLLQLFDKDPEHWQEYTLGLKRDNSLPPIMHKEDIQQRAAGRGLGEMLERWATYDLRIEDEQHGIGGATLTLGLSELVVVDFEASGDHWSGHHYRHPETGNVLTEHWDDKAIMALEEEIGLAALEAAEVDFEVAYSLTYSVLFSRPNPGANN